MSKCPYCYQEIDIIQALQTYDETQGGRQRKLVDAAVQEIQALREQLAAIPPPPVPKKRGRPAKK